MIIVTGMHRSGTSCIAGLLTLCGFSLGTSHPLLNESRPDNVKGHFENLGAVAINETILRRAGGSWSAPPPQEKIVVAGEGLGEEIRLFSETFNGAIVKDPRTCLTISLWERYCASNLESIVLCLRHPSGVAKSLQKRDNIPIDAGLELWARYNASLIKGASKVPVFVVDYDSLESNLPFELASLTEELGIRLSEAEIVELTKGFYSNDLNHAPFEQNRGLHLPDEIDALYQAVRARTSSVRKSGECLRLLPISNPAGFSIHSPGPKAPAPGAKIKGGQS